MHMTDTLDAGGLERVAVNLVNALPRERFSLSLCTTRRGGPLAGLIAPDVAQLELGRRHTVDVRAFWRLGKFLREHNVRVVHAHGTSLFVAVLASFLPPYPSVVWHDHYGYQQVRPRSVSLYRPSAGRARGVIAVNELLAQWSRDALRVRSDRVWYVPNFVVQPSTADAAPDLPGVPGGRVVCVANLRPQKSHPDLLRAFSGVVRVHPEAHLLLVGAPVDAAYAARLPDLIRELSLERSVTLLGERDDVPSILARCDVAVLSSVSEGFPLALVEYGMAGLPVVATAVGQCGEMLEEGRAGVLVAAGDHEAMAAGINDLLQARSRRVDLGERLRQRVCQKYGKDAVLRQVTHVYDVVTAS